MKGKAKFKTVKGIKMLLCSHCSQVIKEGKYFTEDEEKASKGELKLAPQYCDECEEKRIKKYE